MADPPMLWTGPVDSPRRYRVTIDAVAAAVAGGEGLVYRAHDTDRDEAVALKLLTVVHVADYGRLVERSTPFTRIEHPNLMSHVEVFIGTALTDDPTPEIDDFDVIYTVADWIDGEALPDIVDTTETAQLLGYVAGVAHGLHTLHRHRSDDVPLGIVHRDVKPSNVRITPDGRPVLIDFGVARPLDHGDITQGVGTYRWRAPEVLSGSASITTAVDAWGLGAIAYWTLAGQPPGLDGAAAAREQLTHTSRCRQTSDPVGVATHIATLLESDPTKRPVDLARWATQLDTMLARRRRSAWKRPTAVTAVALMAIPGVALLADVSGGDEKGGSSSTTSSPTTAALPAEDLSDTTQPTRELVAAVGEVWHVACLGNADSTIVSGADPGERFTLTVDYAPEVPPAVSDEFPVPVSGATGANGSIGPTLPPGVRSLGPAEVTADATGSFVLEWHCDRSQVGIPVVLTLGGSGRGIHVRVESRDEVTGLEVSVDTNQQSGTEAIRVVAGTTYVLDVIPQLTTDGQAMMTAAGSGQTGRNFDPRLTVTSTDPSVARVVDGPAGVWEMTAVAAGMTVVEARIAGTEHAVTTSVEVVDPPDPPLPVGGHFEPGAVTEFLAPVLNAPRPPLRLSTTDPDPSRNVGVYPMLLPPCGEIAGHTSVTWLAAEELTTPLTAAQTGGALILTHTFADTAAAAEWTATFRTALTERVGSACELFGGSGVTTFETVSDVSSSELIVTLAPGGPGQTPELLVSTAQNVVVVLFTTPEDLAAVRRAIGAALSLPPA